MWRLRSISKFFLLLALVSAAWLPRHALGLDGRLGPSSMGVATITLRIRPQFSGPSLSSKSPTVVENGKSVCLSAQVPADQMRVRVRTAGSEYLPALRSELPCQGGLPIGLCCADLGVGPFTGAKGGAVSAQNGQALDRYSLLFEPRA